ncbi:MAG TPA: bifunctional diaminohydroxyphosphoribosylaminopyrimidine deaminase/5-amino-6-(5-phosphoribosylamino)uracil reductase RibD [Fibrobacteria bacterium]|nr:bifunctional diaminohydroxyphosphoribosylaminopyrimidine deaminase/5-amino-6-(5-phosphoribosylamino)uracil reductase RibD [Fibrobacteria bacterium]
MKKNQPGSPRLPAPSGAPPALSAADARFLRQAFTLARKVKGKTLPNPAVGAVVVKGGRVIGRGATRAAGEAHAEIVALEAAARAVAGSKVSGPKGAGAAAGATLYVTLEPCHHFGRTPPCTRALIRAGIAHVVAACPDPNPRVAGRGFAALRRAGIVVDVAPSGSSWRTAGEELYAGFACWILNGRPLVTVKVAQTLDGRINEAAGRETALTGTAAQRFAHGLRARADAILVGAETVRVDDPDLTPRLVPGLPPQVFVLSRSGKLPRSARIFAAGRSARTWVVAPEKPRNLPDHVGFARLSLRAARAGGRTLARELLKIWAGQGLHEVLVEGGRAVWSPFLEAGAWDHLYVLTAPRFLPRGDSWTKELSPQWVKPLVFHRFTHLGQDGLTEFRRRTSAR